MYALETGFVCFNRDKYTFTSLLKQWAVELQDYLMYGSLQVHIGIVIVDWGVLILSECVSSVFLRCYLCFSHAFDNFDN